MGTSRFDKLGSSRAGKSTKNKKIVTKWSKKCALNLSIPPFCTKFRHDSHGTNGFASYGPQNFELFLVRAGNN